MAKKETIDVEVVAPYTRKQLASMADGRSRAARAIATFTAMESSALNFRTRWQECANYIQQRKGNILTFLSPGQPQTVLVWDTTAEEANNVFAAGIVSFLTPTGEMWMRMVPKSDSAPQAFKEWLDDSSERMLQEIGASNFYETWHEDMLDAGGFGSSLMRVDEYPDDPEGLVNYANIPVGTFYWRENNKGRIGTIARHWKWTAQQAAEEWGVDRLTPQLRKAFDASERAEANMQFEFVELIQKRRREDVRPGITSAQYRPWECLYICKQDNAIIDEQGYYENPYAGLRLMRSNNEAYGRGPGTQAMPTIKMVNRMEQDMLTIIEREARPAWLMPDDTAYTPDNRPDGVTFWDASKGIAYKPEQMQYKNRIDLGEQKTEQKRDIIRRFFFNDMFKLFTAGAEMQREKTAYEVSQMAAERLVLFSPIFGRITQEKLNPLLYRTFSIMYRNGRFKPLPAGIDPRTMEFEISYVSKIALAIKAIQNQAFATAIQLIQSAMAVDPNVVYILDAPKGVRQVLSNTGTPTSWLRSDGEVQQLIQQKQQEAERAQAAAAALAGSQTIKNLGPAAQQSAGSAIPAAIQQGGARSPFMNA